MSESISARRDRRISKENRGSLQSAYFEADSCIIHAGMHAVEPSVSGITTSSTPR